MDMSLLNHTSEFVWTITPHDKMRVPGIIYADEPLIRSMDMKVYEQIRNVAMLPGIVEASYAMPDAHWGYGFPIGGVAAFDPRQGGVVSAGGVGFDISCGVRTLHTGLTVDDLGSDRKSLADELFKTVPAGVGSTGQIALDDEAINAMLVGGAAWAVAQGWGNPRDLDYIEEHGCVSGARSDEVSAHAKRRQYNEMGTLGSGNHYLEVQAVAEIFDGAASEVFQLNPGDIVISIHCGSRGLGHQIGTEFLKSMALAASDHGIELPDRELACAPIESTLGESYLGAMRAAMNCAMANRQIITHLTRQAFAEVLPQAHLTMLYDISHNTCKMETHIIDNEPRTLFVHRKGATRAFGPGYAELPAAYRTFGQPVIIGGSMGTSSYILLGTAQAEQLSFSSACHGAGRAMSRHAAKRRWRGRELVDELAASGILIRSPTLRGIAEEAPGAYKDVHAVVEAAHSAGLARKVARLTPLVCIKG